MIISTKGDIITVSGDLTENEWPALRSVVNLQLNRNPVKVIIDAGGLTALTEEGLLTFVDAIIFSETCDNRLLIKSVPPELLANISGLDAKLSASLSATEGMAVNMTDGDL